MQYICFTTLCTTKSKMAITHTDKTISRKWLEKKFYRKSETMACWCKTIVLERKRSDREVVAVFSVSHDP